MADRNNSSSIGILGIVFIVFLILKLAHIGAVANWSWWWVFAPLWIPLAIVCIIIIIVYMVQNNET